MKPVTADTIKVAQKRIADLVAQQCKDGQQTKHLTQQPPALAAMACGQFFGGNASQWKQRGLHGTAAALSILAREVDYEDVVTGLLAYLERRAVCDNQDNKTAVAPGFDQRWWDDENNVIKISEVLRSLKHVPNKSPSLHKTYSERLASAKAGNLWPHFLGGTDPSSPVATAFAVLAASEINNHREAVQHLYSEYDRYRTSAQFDPVAPAMRILILYCLTFRAEWKNLDKDERDKLRNLVKQEVAGSGQLLWTKSEQTLQYNREQVNHYLHVPWQLYLLALQAVSDPQSLYAFRTQQRLNTICDLVKGSGFHYGGSNGHLSTRTNGILYDVLEAVRDAMISSPPTSLTRFKERILWFLGGRVGSSIIGFGYVALGFGLAALFDKSNGLLEFTFAFYGLVLTYVWQWAVRVWKAPTF
ncbi:MAG: hypothetical protein ABL949_13110 [Fimbriimonadaceae bacterium]